MKLSGKQYQRLQNALLDTYQTRDELAQFVRLELEENLQTIVNDDTLSVAVFELIRWAESRGRLPDLVRAAHAARPHNDTFAAFATEMGVRREPTPHAAEPSTDSVPDAVSDAVPDAPAPAQTAPNPGGQTQIDGNVEAGGDFTGRDNTVHGNQVRGERVTYVDKQYVSGQSAPPAQENSSPLSRGTIAWGLAIIGLIASLITIAQWRWPPPTSTPAGATATLSATAPDSQEATSFDYTLTVVDDATEEPIANAQVQLYIEGRAPLQGYADSRGFARIPIPAAFAQRPGQLTVTAAGYGTENRSIDLWPDQLPTQIRMRNE